MLSRRIPRGPGAMIAALATALGVCLAAFFGLVAPAAPPAAAVTGGQDSATLNGQVQFYVSDHGVIGDPEEYECSGTLIDPSWVLTAKHCIENPGATVDNSGFLVGDRRIGEGLPRVPVSIHLDPDTDTALVEFEDPVGRPDLAVGYGQGTPAIGTNVAIRGWGSSPAEAPPAQVLQVATMRTEQTGDVGGDDDDRLLFANVGQGVIDQGDSGAGVYVGRRVYGVVSTTFGFLGATAVPTNDTAGWIEQTSGVAPTNAAPSGGAPDEGIEPPPTVPFEAPVPTLPDDPDACVNPLNPEGVAPVDDPQNGPVEPADPNAACINPANPDGIAPPDDPQNGPTEAPAEALASVSASASASAFPMP